MYNCFDVSKEIINLASKEGYPMPPMKLLKLAYIAQGYYLGFYDKPLFQNEIQAWKYGPVIPDLYHVTKRYGRRNVDPFVLDIYTKNELSEADKHFVSLVWNTYKHNDGIELSALTHQEGSPWSTVYEDGVFHKSINNEVIKDYYKQLISQRGASTNK